MTMPVWDPLMDGCALSVAVIDCVPAVLRVALKVPTPEMRIEFEGTSADPSAALNWALESLELNPTVPP